MTPTSSRDPQALLADRYQDPPALGPDTPITPTIAGMLARGSCRRFLDRPVPAPWLELLCATALASPTKSDLQQRDIVLLSSPNQRQRLAALVGSQDWVAGAPMLAVFCGNHRRQRQLHDLHDIAFANDHFDAVLNAAADAAIAMGAFITAAESLGLGCCPISAVRNEAQAVSDLLALPDHVFPFAGLAIGFPADPDPVVSKRLPLKLTCHTDRFHEDAPEQSIRAYDAHRAAAQPYGTQRFTAQFGESASYGWSEDKARQYSQPERAGFGAFIRAKGFSLD